jgi:uncharacterized protein YuzE
MKISNFVSALFSMAFILPALSQVAEASPVTCHMVSKGGYGVRNFACDFYIDNLHVQKARMISSQTNFVTAAQGVFNTIEIGDEVTLDVSEFRISHGTRIGIEIFTTTESISLKGVSTDNPSYTGQEADDLFVVGGKSGNAVSVLFYASESK